MYVLCTRLYSFSTRVVNEYKILGSFRYEMKFLVYNKQKWAYSIARLLEYSSIRSNAFFSSGNGYFAFLRFFLTRV